MESDQPPAFVRATGLDRRTILVLSELEFEFETTRVHYAPMLIAGCGLSFDSIVSLVITEVQGHTTLPTRQSFIDGIT